ncbi:hypothetical protein D7S86_16070 [Pararobbsia silviterrae]|uniref:Uncharacterized protein n=1 Tax=Pararobbsia silviterrae TaxID=1792498 RepID=A0A494XTV4_9BURK|nr:hypothetical protein D7S86_16070 [Pararobbsia silviterrae]
MIWIARELVSRLGSERIDSLFGIKLGAILDLHIKRLDPIIDILRSQSEYFRLPLPSFHL